MPFKSSPTSEYIREHLRAESDPLLCEMLDYADRNHIPVLLPESVALLRQIVRIARPKTALEVGTAIGYSAQIILREGCEKIYTIEKDESRADKAKEYFGRAGLSHRAVVFVGDANEIVPLLDGSFDLIFLDGPKTRYPHYLPYLKRLLAPEGILVCDNVLWNDMVSGEAETPHKKETIVRGLDEFLSALAHDDEFITSILPVGDGIAIAVKNR